MTGAVCCPATVARCVQSCRAVSLHILRASSGLHPGPTEPCRAIYLFPLSLVQPFWLCRYCTTWLEVASLPFAMVTTRTSSQNPAHSCVVDQEAQAAQPLAETCAHQLHHGLCSAHSPDSDAVSTSHDVVKDFSAEAENAPTAAADLVESYLSCQKRRALGDLQSKSAASQSPHERLTKQHHHTSRTSAGAVQKTQTARTSLPGSLSAGRRGSNGMSFCQHVVQHWSTFGFLRHCPYEALIFCSLTIVDTLVTPFDETKRHVIEQTA